ANSFIQLSTTHNLRGRVMSVYSFVFLGFTPIGNFLMGIMSERIGTTNTVAAASLVCLAGAVIFSVKHLQKQP
ncbi:MAG: MFS transporter, partial [Nitrospirae bacterium]|nr:MFS transporter [Nitrospirota bacterium]